MPSARQSTKVLKEKTRSLQRNELGGRLRSQMKNQKAKALRTMKAAKDRGEEYFPERKDNILGRGRRRLELWREHLKDPIVALDKAVKCVESSVQVCLSAREPCGGSDLQWLVQASSNVCGSSRSGRAFGPTWARGIVCVCAQHLWSGMCQGSTGRMAIKKEHRGETSFGKVWKTALPSLDFDAELVVHRCCSREFGARRGSGGAEGHYRVGCGQKHQSGPGRMRSEAPKWTWMAKAFRTSRQKSFREKGNGQMELAGLK